MKIFSLFCVLFLLESAWGVSDSFERVTGNYTSVFGDELEYHLTKTTNDTHSDRLFVFIPGDGDNCTERENYYKKSLEAWEALAGEYVESGDWVFPEATIDRYCEVRANKLDGIDYYHRVNENALLVKSILANNSQYNHVYLIGYSAGAMLAPLVAIELGSEGKLAGVMMGGFMGRRFSSYMAESYTRWIEEQATFTDQELLEFYMNLRGTFKAIRQSCSPTQKSLAAVWGEGDNSQIRTDNFYCQQDDPEFPQKLGRLPQNLPVLVMQGAVDPALQSSVTEGFYRYAQLKDLGKSVTFKSVPGMTHSWRRSGPDFFKVIRDWASGL
ncbi:MAG: hypothetical protein CL677_09055 [Bdellovibrionaceae bacterium]|nr:hypothetical protein [Pseudobdellovibrionaceae bacterium]|tara:strand:+ start:73494 stop:74474 length:981 start_codon:yes stop_codon:yes gene_type:complete